MATRKEIENAISHFKIKANQLAHPVNLVFDDGEIQHHGLTKREYFAAMAMQGLLANPNGGMQKGGGMTFSPVGISELAVLHADALLAELEKTEKA
jgi:hypothetical protein